MRNIIYTLLFLPFLIKGQDSYMVQYDRISDVVKYYELTYQNGKYKEKEIERPTVSKGDLIKFQCINTNEFIFKINIPQYNQIAQQDESTVSNVTTGFENVLSGNNSALDELINLNRWPPEKPANTRSAMSEQERLRNNELGMLNVATTKLENVLNSIVEYEDLVNIIYSDSLTLDEIRETYNKSLVKFDFDSYNNIKDELEDYKSEIDSFENVSVVESDPFYDGYEYVSEEINYNENMYNPDNRLQMKELLDNATFVLEHTIIVGIKDYMVEELYQESEFIEFNLSFCDPNISEDFNNPYNNVIQNKLIRLPIAGTSKLSFASGITFVSPFRKFKNYSFVQNVNSFDSLMINENEGPAFRTNIGTNVTIEFNNKSSITPNLSIGMGLSFLEDDKTSINYLLGGGFKFKKFPYLSLTGGVSFIELYEIKDGFSQNNWYYFDSYSDNSVEDEFLEKSYAPGYFFGINLNF
tara:strand:+ start:264 stop:1670 length:1407 start_codon:yes stop_codon:yes gene_type:complete